MLFQTVSGVDYEYDLQWIYNGNTNAVKNKNDELHNTRKVTDKTKNNISQLHNIKSYNASNFRINY